MMDFTKDMEKVCPDALFINYTNPMSMLTLAMNKATPIKTIGLCHSHQECIPMLFKTLDLPTDGLNYKIAGINHMAWLLEITRYGEDFYPVIKSMLQRGRFTIVGQSIVRQPVCLLRSTPQHTTMTWSDLN